MNTWVEVTEHRYDEMLGILPPAEMTGNGFLVGEASDHRLCKITGRLMPRYAAFIERKGRYFEGHEPMTLSEFRAIEPAEVAAAL